MPHSVLHSESRYPEGDQIQFSPSRLARWIGVCCLVVLCMGASGLVSPHAPEGAEPTGVRWVEQSEQQHYAYLPELPRVRHQLNSAAPDAAALSAIFPQDNDPLAVHGFALASPCALLIGRARWLAARADQAKPRRLPPPRAPPNMQAV